MRKIPVLFLFLFVLLATGACRRGQPNVVLITFDTTRADHIGYAIGREGLTPNLDRLAAGGTWFSTAVAVQPLTAPSHGSILTGRYPFHHGLRNNGGYVLGEESVTITERLKQAGYATHAIVSSFVLDSQFGFDQGFDSYDDDLRGSKISAKFMFREIPADRVADKALAWLNEKRPKEQPFFLWLHFYDPHADWAPPKEIAAKFPDDPYSGEIHFADQQLGRVLDRIGEFGLHDDTLYVFTADHGESLGDHGEKTHGIFIYDATTRVPLFLRGPGVPEGRVDAVVRSVDIVPTLAELLDLPAGGDVDGASLVSLMKGKEEAEGRIAYSESFAPLLNFGWSVLRSHRSADVRVVDAPRREVYDVTKDAKETRNLYRENGDLPADARRSLAGLLKIADSDPIERGGHRQGEVDAETRKKLAALGYVMSDIPESSGPRADPKDRIVYWEDFQRAQALIRHKRYDEAVAKLRALLEVDSENTVAMMSLANAFVATRHYDDALDVFKRMVALTPQAVGPYLGSSRVLQLMGRVDEAKTLAGTAIQVDPESADGYVALADIHLEQEEYGEAERLFRRALEVAPESSLAVSGLGNCLNRAGRQKEALAFLKDGYEKNPESQAIVYNLAVVSDRLGDRETALRLYQESLKLDDEHSMSWNNLGSLLNRMGQRQRALQCVLKAHELDEDNVEATFNAGSLLLRAGRAEEALRLFDEALAKRPALMEAAALRAGALARLGRIDESIRAWQQIAPKLPAAWLQIAKIEAQRGNTAAAKSALDRGLAAAGPRAAAAARKDADLSRLMGS